MRELSSKLCIDPKEKNIPTKVEMNMDDVCQFPWVLQCIFSYQISLYVREDEINIEALSEISSIIPSSFPLVVEIELISVFQIVVLHFLIWEN